MFVIPVAGLQFATNILEKIFPGCQLKQLPEINAVIYPECQAIGLFQKGENLIKPKMPSFPSVEASTSIGIN